MYARVNIIFGRRDKVDDGLAHLEESDRGAVASAAGNLGLTTFADREAGVIVAVSYWDEPAHSSEAVLTRAREDAAAAAGGDLVVESYEVVAQDRRSVPSSGAAVRVERVQIDSSKIADGVGFIRDEVLPQLRTSAGFCSAELLIDLPDGSKTLMPAAWTDRDTTTANEGQALDRAPAILAAPAELLHAHELVAGIGARVDAGGGQAARKPPCEEDKRAARAAEFDARTDPGIATGSDLVAARDGGRRRDPDPGPADRPRRHDDDDGGLRRGARR